MAQRSDASGPGGGLTALSPAVRAARAFSGRAPGADAEAAVDDLFPDRADLWTYVLQFSALIALSASIAGFGLLADSAGVVIGAMLVAPLMTPILAASAATVRARNRDLAEMAAIIAWGTVLAIAVGFVVAVIAGDGVAGAVELPGELESRTFPGLLDLGIAVTAGAAAGYIVPRRSTLAALPGVGIAVALVPPLATVGISWQLGRGGDAGNALLLYVTNLAAIVFAASIMLLLSGFRPHVQVSRRAMWGRIAVTLTAVTVVAIPLAVHTQESLESSRLTRTTSGVIEAWDPTAEIVSLETEIRSGVARIEVVVTGPNDPSDVWRIAEQIRDDSGRPVELDLRYQKDTRVQVTAR